MKSEEWKDIPGEPLHYQASSLGRIRRVDSPLSPNRIISTCIQGKFTKYHKANIKQGFGRGNVILKSVHRLVLLAFNGQAPEGKPYACHIDGNSLNNIPENLKWGSQLENIQDALNVGAFAVGQRSGSAKITNQQAIEIYNSPKKTRDLVKQYGLTRTTIKMIRNGTIWSTVTGAKRHFPAIGAKQWTK